MNHYPAIPLPFRIILVAGQLIQPTAILNENQKGFEREKVLSASAFALSVDMDGCLELDGLVSSRRSCTDSVSIVCIFLIRKNKSRFLSGRSKRGRREKGYDEDDEGKIF